ncbi:MAG: beta-galactosidase [Microcella sp.]|uniref:beta-galactosidase n=1 Tax=Microcella sp. TaxID=1913979 RepID=UPI0024CB4D44|nr:beta-galactosidase [Microcella sp.]UYN82732.1 MAG: beta-galactosidase [Microcella sp.]
MHYGADYNPEQWPESVWPDDIARMRDAGVTMVSLGIFSWSRLQPAPDEWSFDWLDRVIELLHEGGIAVDLATATASPPPWLAHLHPETLAADERGAAYWPGSRQHHAVASPVYRRYGLELVRRLAERYADHPAVVLWHVDNELGCHLPLDYSDAARDAFRVWLADRYGSVDALNEAWGTNFWSQRYRAFDEIVPPRLAPYSHNPGQLLDFRRFTSDTLLSWYLQQKQTVRDAGARQPITTNMMGAFKPTDYFAWAEHMDVISDDAYPDPNDPESFRRSALQRDLMRSLKPGTPWLLLEQSTNALNWRPSNAPKAPGQMAALSAQAIGRGADSVLFFQWRQSRAGAEKFHSAMLPLAGTDTRTWREVVDLGARLAALPELPPPAVDDARVAIVLDWPSWWALEAPDHPVALDQQAILWRWYDALHERHVMVDIVSPSRVAPHHRLVIAPALYLLTDDDAQHIADWVAAGGQLLAGPFTDIVDEFDRFPTPSDGRPGYQQRWRDLLGIRLEDFGALVSPDAPASEPGERLAPFGPSTDDAAPDARPGPHGVGTLLAEHLHLAGAEAEARFSAGRRAGDPALTRHAHGAGAARYLATLPDRDTALALVDHLLADPVFAGAHLRESEVLRRGQLTAGDVPGTVEVARRGPVLTVINHGSEPVTLQIPGRVLLETSALASAGGAPSARTESEVRVLAPYDSIMTLLDEPTP